MKQISLFQSNDELDTALLNRKGTSLSEGMSIGENIELAWQTAKEDRNLQDSFKEQFIRDIIANTVYTLSFLSQTGEKNFLVEVAKYGFEKASEANRAPYNAFDKKSEYFTDQYVQQNIRNCEKDKRRKRMISAFNSELQIQLIYNRILKAHEKDEDYRDPKEGPKFFFSAPIGKVIASLKRKEPNEQISKSMYEHIHKKYLGDIFHYLMIINNQWTPFSDLSYCDRLCYYYALERIFHSNLILSLLKELAETDKETLKKEIHTDYVDDIMYNEDVTRIPPYMKIILDNTVILSKLPAYINGKIKITKNSDQLYDSNIEQYEQMMKGGMCMLLTNFASEKELLAELEMYLRDNWDKFKYERVSEEMTDYLPDYYKKASASFNSGPEEQTKLFNKLSRDELLGLLNAIYEIFTGEKVTLENRPHPMDVEELDRIIKCNPN